MNKTPLLLRLIGCVMMATPVLGTVAAPTTTTPGIPVGTIVPDGFLFGTTYQKQLAGSACESGKVITAESDCYLAARELLSNIQLQQNGLPQKQDLPGVPRGCFVNRAGLLVLNANPIGSTQADSLPLCYIEAVTTTPTSMTTKVFVGSANGAQCEAVAACAVEESIFPWVHAEEVGICMSKKQKSSNTTVDCYGNGQQTLTQQHWAGTDVGDDFDSVSWTSYCAPLKSLTSSTPSVCSPGLDGGYPSVRSLQCNSAGKCSLFASYTIIKQYCCGVSDFDDAGSYLAGLWFIVTGLVAAWGM